jgi:hypothetical protein
LKSQVRPNTARSPGSGGIDLLLPRSIGDLNYSELRFFSKDEGRAKTCAWLTGMTHHLLG